MSKKLVSVNKGKFIRFFDLSGLDWAIIIDERLERLEIRCPGRVFEEDKDLFPDYTWEEFKTKTIIEKIEWMLEHLKFIPYRIDRETIDIEYDRSNLESHKFSHIEQNEMIMDELQEYLSNSKYKPNGNVYYFVKYWRGKTYLVRDTNLSPKVAKE